jgi:hypothetical protein
MASICGQTRDLSSMTSERRLDGGSMVPGPAPGLIWAGLDYDSDAAITR